MAPSMIQGFDDIGMAILKNRDDLEKFNEVYTEMLNNADYIILDEASKVWKDPQNSRKGLENEGWDLDMAKKRIQRAQAVLSSNDLDATVDEYIGHTEDINVPAQIQSALYGEGFEYNPSKYRSAGDFLADAIRTDEIRVKRIVESFEENMDDSIAGISSVATAYVDKFLRSSAFSGIDSAMATRPSPLRFAVRIRSCRSAPVR